MKKRSNVKRFRSVVFIGSFLFVLLAFTGLGLSQKAPKKTPELVRLGKSLFEKACIYCHGPNGDGKGTLAARLKTPPADFTKPLSQWINTGGEIKKIFDTIATGVPDTAMAKFHYSDEERWALAYRVMEFSQEKAK